MKEKTEHTIPCLDRRDLERRRDGLKSTAIHEKLFLRMDGDTVVLENGNRYTFVVGSSVPEIDDESLPREAFK